MVWRKLRIVGRSGSRPNGRVIARREFMGAVVGTVCAGEAQAAVGRGPHRRGRDPFVAELADIERSAGVRLGAWVLDTGIGRGLGWRADERFGQCSTFKLSLAACVLAGVDAGRIGAGEVLRFSAADLLPNSPVTAAHAGEGGMSVLALAEAAQKTSDNLAANLLLRRIGGPAALTAFWRRLGAAECRLDRFEPDLNFVPPGEQRDTVTPGAIARAVGRIVAGPVLTPTSRELLLGWMAQTATGTARIRAGLPQEWRAGDKTGTGMRAGMGNLVNDIAVVFPRPAAPPLVIAGFCQAPGFFPQTRPADEAVLARVGAVAARWAAASMPQVRY